MCLIYLVFRQFVTNQTGHFTQLEHKKDFWPDIQKFRNHVKRVLILIFWTGSGSGSWVGFWTRSWPGSWCISFLWRFWVSLCRLMLHRWIGTGSAPWPWFRFCFSFTIFFGWLRHRPGSAPWLRLLFGSAVGSWPPVRFHFRLTIWSGFSAFRSGTWSIFASGPRFRTFQKKIWLNRLQTQRQDSN